MTLRCKLVKRLTNGDGLWRDWEALLTRVRPELALFGPAWYALWSRTLGADKRWTGELWLVTVRDQRGVLRGILPIGRQKLGPLHLYSIAGGWQPRRTVVADADHEFAVGRALGQFIARSRWLGLRLGPCVRSAPSMRALIEALRQNHAFTHRQQESPLAVCDVPGTWEEYRSLVLGGKFNRKIGNYERRLQRAGQVEIKHYRQPSPEETRELVDQMGHIESRSWLASADNGQMRFAPRNGRAMWSQLIDSTLSPNDQIDCWIISLDGQPISFCFTLTALPVRYVIANNYDEAAKTHRTGSILYRYMVQDGIERGVKHFDFGDREIHYKKYWGASYQDFVDSYIVVPNRLLGHMAGAALWLRDRVRPNNNGPGSESPLAAEPG